MKNLEVKNLEVWMFWERKESVLTPDAWMMGSIGEGGIFAGSWWVFWADGAELLVGWPTLPLISLSWGWGVRPMLEVKTGEASANGWFLKLQEGTWSPGTGVWEEDLGQCSEDQQHLGAREGKGIHKQKKTSQTGMWGPKCHGKARLHRDSG